MTSTRASSLSILDVTPATISPADGRQVAVDVRFAAVDDCAGVTILGHAGDVPATSIVDHGDGTFTASFIVGAVPGTVTLALEARDAAGKSSGVASAAVIVPLD